MLMMKDLREFKIPFVGLKEGKHEFDYRIDNSFFDLFDFDEFYSSDIRVKVDFVKKPTLFELNFIIDGTVNVDCDRTGEPFDMTIHGQYPLIVKFGEEKQELDEDLLIIPFSAFELDLSHYIYENIVLSVPLKRVNQDSEEIEIKLENKNEKNKDKGHDPRWDKLNKLITGK